MANIISKINASNVDYAIRAGYMYYGKTSGTASALTVTITDTNNQIISIPELVRGMVLVLNLNVVPTESATLSVNGLPAKPIQYGVGEGGTKWSIDETYIFIYNGTAFVAISNYDNYNVTTTGSGNAITSITKDGKTITATKGSTFLTAHPTISKSTDTTSSETVQHQGSFTVVDSITRDDNGHVTKINTKTVTLPTAPDKLPNPKSLTVGGKTYDGSNDVTITASDLGLDSALKYHGVTTTALTDGATTNPIVINGANHTAATGCVVFYSTKEFVFDGKKWTELGDGSNHKIKQTAVASPSASTTTSTTFIDTISQDANGVITATKKTVYYPTIPGSFNITANATDDDVVILTGSGGANSVSYDAKHAQKGPSAGYTSGNTTTSISGTGGTIKIPQITVDKYGHVTAAADESVTITIPSLSGGSSASADATVVGGVTVNGHAITVGKKTIKGSGTVNVTGTSSDVTISSFDSLTSICGTIIPNGSDLNDYSTFSPAGVYYTQFASNTDTLLNCPISGVAIKLISINNNYANNNWSTQLLIASGKILYRNTSSESESFTAWQTLVYSPNNTAIGSSTQPVYCDSAGQIRACRYSLNKDVPATAAFTDKSVTSATNHYTPSTDANSALSVDASSSTAATWNSTQLVTGVNLTRDSKGHVTGLTVDSIKMPANPNTDTQVTAVGKHYTPSGGSAATATASGSTLAFGGAVITGVTKDAAGHVTGVTTSKLPANPNTDTQADWNVTTTTSAAYIKNKPTIPTIPASLKNPHSLTIQGNGTNIATYDGSSAVTANIPAASTSTYGITKLSDAVNSTSTTLAATANAVKKAYDLANGKTANTGTVTKVSTGVGLTGGDITGTGTIKANLKSETSLGTIGTTSKLYAVGIDANKQLCVNVPWTDNNTTYSAATTSAAGLMSASDKSKLDGIASGAEVNVQSDWNATSGDAFIKNKPAIPIVNDPTIKINQNNVTLGYFSLNQSSDKTIDLPDHTFAFGNSTTIDFTSKRRTYNVITTTSAVNIAYSSTKTETGLEHYMLIKNNASTMIKVNFPTGTIIKSATVNIDPGSYVEISAIYVPSVGVVVTISDKLTQI